MSTVLGVVLLSRNGARTSFHQDPSSYAPGQTDSTPLGVTTSHTLGTSLRSTYLTPTSPSFISDITPSTALADTKQIKILAKAGGEGPAVFDSAIALLQGLFPPTEKNMMKLANGTVVRAPLGGYQYVPIETVEPGNDRMLESWTDCPEFKKHISAVRSSSAFAAKSTEAQPFLRELHDFVFGRPATLDNIWNIYDFMSTQLVYNQTYAYRLPPTYINQVRALADWHENAIFSSPDMNGVGNVAGRTILHPVLNAVERIAFNGDPLKLMLVETTYQPFISLFHQMDMIKEHPELAGIPNFGATLAIELRRGAPPDTRDFLRFKFQNGTEDNDGWQLLHAFGHRGDIPLTEFVYRIQGSAIASNREWGHICGVPEFTTSSSSFSVGGFGYEQLLFAIGAMLLLAVVFMGKKLSMRRRCAVQSQTTVVETVMSEKV
ncbi:histidine phosphatase superfamily [Favolaschia claudopus]|uniref:Histidine phosphatase superfamily n=1 Tax=Favolaschia claudopus TaxID=2862362 RepID=A0AAW0AJH8_9AGAR